MEAREGLERSVGSRVEEESAARRKMLGWSGLVRWRERGWEEGRYLAGGVGEGVGGAGGHGGI